MSSYSIGVVKWFNTQKGFGFISQEQGPDIFVNFRSLVNSNGFLASGRRTLSQGQKVQFKTVRTLRGLHAREVVIL